MFDKTELELLKERATKMGISFSPNISLATLQARIDNKMNESTDGTQEEAVEEPVTETTGQKKARLRREAQKLVRVQISCMNPNKADWPGEIIAISNDVIGTVKKFIPFNSPEGYHVPECLLNVVKARQFRHFYKAKNKRGEMESRSKWKPEFSIQELPPLTEEELKDIALRQQAQARLDEDEE